MDGRACGSTLATSSFAPCLTTTFTTRHGELIETNAAERVIDKIHPSQVFSAPPCPVGIRGRNTLEVPTGWARCCWCCELTAEAWNRFSFPYPQRSSGSRAADIAAQWQRTPPNKDTLHQYELGQTRSERHVAVDAYGRGPHMHCHISIRKAHYYLFVFLLCEGRSFTKAARHSGM